jgi:hypothetical protein
MRYRRAVEKLRQLAEACEEIKSWPPDDPFLLEAYVFGDLLTGADPLEAVHVALVLHLPPDEVPWESEPDGASWLADRLRLSKGGFQYFWRSYLDPAWNHYIRGPVRFWSHDGPDEAVFTALSERRFGSLRRLIPEPEVEHEQVEAELDKALRRLRTIRDAYWDRDWRREHSGLGRYPEHALWEAVEGYLDLRDALVRPPAPGRAAGPDGAVAG